jgi:glucose-6-phosphate 1-epimerase
VKVHSDLDVQALEARWGRAPGVRFAQSYNGQVVVLEAAGSKAVIALQGAQVLSWYPAGQSKDVLWLSPFAKLGTGKPVRGGIPVCWPWFGPHAGDPQKPAHGFVRAAPWRVAGSAASAVRSRLVLKFDTATLDPGLWPTRATAEIEITVGATLTVALSTDNLSSESIELTEALHTYLNVGDIAQVNVTGLEGRSYIDQTSGHTTKLQSGPIMIGSEVDRIYLDTADAVVVRDKQLGRKIKVSKAGSMSTVVWNPWIEKAQRLGDIGPDGHRQMLCIETANAAKNMVTLAPRVRHRIITELSVNKI